MTNLPIAGVFNDGYIAEVYEQFQRDPASVDESWRQYFALAERLAGAERAAAAVPGDAASLRKVAGAAALVQAIRQYGHLLVRLDPLGSPPLGAGELTPEFHGIVEADLAGIPAAALGFEGELGNGTAADVISRLRETYSSTLGFEVEHIQEDAEREWFRAAIERGEGRRALTPDEKKAVLRRLTEVDGLERFLGRAYQGMKRFSIEGTDALVPMMDFAIAGAAESGAHDVVIGMAHRGRVNVLAHILDKPYATLFDEFAGKHAVTNAASDTGDVKYHLGKRTERTLGDGRSVNVMLVPNPSHLEFVNPVLAGVARALQRIAGSAKGEREELGVLPIVVHGDAAFPGEGVVAETFNMSALRGYRVGGTLHIIANNQVGFTTDPRDGRSTYYASDLAKGFEVPIVHVNADDAEGCIAATRLALAYRARFKKDFLIDLVGYRRHGHNEQDEPAYTQPTLYDTIRKHPAPRVVWGERLVADGVIAASDVKELDDAIQADLGKIHDDLHAGAVHPAPHEPGDQSEASAPSQVETAVKAEQLASLNERMLSWNSGFAPLPKLAKQLERRRSAFGESGGIDWGHAEALAWASLLAEGVSVRLTGQDAERGTFSHRQAVLHDPSNNATFAPLANIAGAPGSFEVYNSPLSETAVMGFEYGFSVIAADTLTLWEAQFGDFVNVAQPIIDQFMAADRAKWGQDSGLVLLLPHGYEGQGPEHSSARLERFLQLCAEGNLRVAYPSTPAQYFHILRRQALLAERRPLILMQPKSLLRAPQATSRLGDLAEGGFRAVIDDDAAPGPDAVRRLVLCSGKLYYDLANHADRASAPVAIVRVEELYPWPHEEITRIVDRYARVTDVVWAQEEPQNMGAWTYAAQRLRAAVGNVTPVRYIGRPERASPAEGYVSSHQEQQAAIVVEALRVAEPKGEAKGEPKKGEKGRGAGVGARH